MSGFAAFTEADRASLAQLWGLCDLSRPWNPAGADIDAALAHPGADILVAHAGTRVIASVLVGYDGHRGWLYYVAVHPDHRGQGLGQAAVRAGEDWLRARAVVKVQLMVRETNARVMGFYQALDYEDAHVRVLAKWLVPDRDAAYRAR